VSRGRRLVTHYYGFPLVQGGVESHILSLVEHGSREEFEWTVAGVPSPEFAGAAARVGARLDRWAGPGRRLDPAAVVGFAELLREWGTDVLHVHGPRWLLHVARAGRRAGVPVVATVHLPVSRLMASSGTGRAARLVAYRWVRRRLGRRWVDWTIFVAASARDEYVAAGLVDPGRCTVVPNGIDLSRFGAGRAGRAAQRAALGTPPEVPVVVSVARLETQKAADVLLDAAARLRVPLEIWLVGEGSQRATLERAAAVAGPAVRVRLLGGRGDIPEVLAAADIFALPSRVEAAPVALIEAMAAGLPSVVSDVGDCAAMIGSDAAGIVVPPEDPGALAAALERLAGDPVRRRAMEAAARARSQLYDVTEMARSTETIYRRVLAG